MLDALGVGAEARALGAPIDQMLGHAGTRVVLDVRYRRGAPGLAMHRASLFDVLWQAAQGRGVAMVTGSAATAVEAGWVQRENAASVGPFDLVVDASGAGSRSVALDRAAPALWRGLGVRGLARWGTTCLTTN